MKKRLFFTINVIAPIVLGAVLYYLFFPDTIFVKYVDKIFKVSFHFVIGMDHILLQFMRSYGFDFLWAYAFMSAVICLLGYEKKYVYIVILFEVILESLQLIPELHGTFDICDILIEIAANILVIKKSEGDLKNEKVKSV